MGRAEASWTQGEAGGRKEVSRAAFRRRLEEKPPPGSRRKSPRRSARRTPPDAPQVRPAVSVRRRNATERSSPSFSRRPSRKCASGISVRRRSPRFRPSLVPKFRPIKPSNPSLRTASVRGGRIRPRLRIISSALISLQDSFFVRGLRAPDGGGPVQKSAGGNALGIFLKAFLRFFPVSNAFIGSPNRHARLS
jgi:hypothetical protein